MLLMGLVWLQIECVGSVSCGIKAAAWSPDLDLLVIITGLPRFYDCCAGVHFELSYLIVLCK